MQSNEKNGRDFYALAWRWHFYAGLFVAPFMIPAGADRNRLPVQAATGCAALSATAAGRGRCADAQRRPVARRGAPGAPAGRRQPVPAAERGGAQRAIRDWRRGQAMEPLRRSLQRARTRPPGCAAESPGGGPGTAWRADGRDRRRPADRAGRRLGHRPGGLRSLSVVAARAGGERAVLAAPAPARTTAVARATCARRFLGQPAVAVHAAQRDDLDRLLGQAVRRCLEPLPGGDVERCADLRHAGR